MASKRALSFTHTHTHTHDLQDAIPEGPLLHVCVSFASVIFGVTAMQPTDVVRTRLYNQVRILSSIAHDVRLDLT